MTWTDNLANGQLKDLATQAIADNSYGYQELLALLNAAASGGITASEFADLKAIYSNSAEIFASDYVKTITYNVIYGNPANATWWGGARHITEISTLGNMAAETSEEDANRLIGKWFLGLDLPMPVAGGDTATGKASQGIYTYSMASGELFVSGAAAADVNQGASGTCYLLASLGSIADAAPSLISNAVIDNGNGTYGIRLYLNGAELYTTVNKSLPVNNGVVIFASNPSHSLSGETWVSLFEKAYVQFNAQADVGDRNTTSDLGWNAAWNGESSYQAVEGGFAYPIREFTNLSYKYYSSYYSGIPDSYASGQFVSTNPATYKQTIIDGLAAGSIGWLSTSGNTYDTNGKQNFVAGHAFMLLGYDASTDKFIVRNPWGAGGISYNAEFKVAITEFWNATVKGVVALSDAVAADPVFTYTLTSSAATAGNGASEGGAVTFTITRSGSGVASTVYLSTTPGTAGFNDFQGADKTALNFATYETSKTITVNTNTDSLTEGDEYFTLDLYKKITDASSNVSAIGHIKDTTVPEYTYSIVSGAGTANNAALEGSAIAFTITRSGTGNATTVYLSTAPDTAGAGDFQGISQQALNFAAYETSKTITINTLADTSTEGVEQFSLDLYKNPGDSVKAATAPAYLTDQVLPAYTYAVTSSAGSPATAVLEGAKATFTITRSGGGSETTVYVSTANGSAASGDYVGITNKAITFTANQTIATVEVDTVQDWWLDADEYFTLNLYTTATDTAYSAYGAAFIKDKPFSDYNYTLTSNATANAPVSEGGKITFTVTRSDSGSASIVYLSTVAGSAGASDVEGMNLYELDFAAYETSKTVALETLTDSLTEGDEYFWLDLYRTKTDSSSAAYTAAYIQDATPVEYSYTVASNATFAAPASEGGAVTFTVTRSGTGAASTIYVSTSSGSALASGDFNNLDTSALNFAAYETTKTITVDTYQDNVAEGNEYFWLDLYKTYGDALSGSYATYSSAYVADATATDYSYTITSDADYWSPASEGGTVTFTVTRSGSGSASSVYVSTYAGSAGDDDYQEIDKSLLNFASYETSKTVTVNINSDGLTENDEYFYLELFKSYADAVDYNYDSWGYAYIEDDEVADYDYTVDSNASSTAVVEGGAVTFTVTRSGSGSASTVYVSTSDGTSFDGSDYAGLGTYALDFAAYETTKTITVNTYQDYFTEGGEYFWLDLYRTYGDAQIGNFADYAIAYVEDSALADYSYTVDSNASSTAVVEGGAVTFTVTRSGSGSASTVYVSTSDGTSFDGSDYAGLGTYALDFATYETIKTVTVNTYQDDFSEDEEYFWLDLYRTYGDAQVGNYADYAIAYVEDSALADYSYTVDSNASSTAVVEGDAVTFTVTRSGSGSASTVYVSTSDGTAFDGSDYAGLGTYALDFAAYETTKTITVNTYQDDFAEGEEYFWLDLYRTYGDAQIGNYADYAIAYVEDSALADYSYTVDSNASSTAVVEGDAVTFTVTRSGSGSASTVYVSTSDGTSFDGSDYAGLGTYALDFAAYETTKTITVNTYQDDFAEGEEYFWLDLYRTYGDAQIGNYADYAIAYVANSTLADFSYTVASNASSTAVAEGGSITFTITRSGSGSASTVFVSTTDGSAYGDIDYAYLDTYAVSFGANETSKTVTIPTYQDGVAEGDEYFWLDLYRTYGDALLGDWADYAVAYVADSTLVDYSYAVASNASSTAVAEGGNVTFTITRSGSGSGSASTVYVSTTDGSAYGDIDYAYLDTYAVSFGANETSKTVTIPTYQDGVAEGEEYFWLDLYQTYGDAQVGNWADYAIAYVADSTLDNYSYTVASNAEVSPVAEGGTVTFTITRSGSGSASTVYVSATDGSAYGDIDYAYLDTYAVSFGANETSKTVTIPTYQDGVAEGEEYFWLDLYQTYGDAQTGNWADYAIAYVADSTLASYTYDVDSNAWLTAVAEGGAVTFTITRSGSGSASTVYVRTTDGSAHGDLDYAYLDTYAVSFGADETSKTITVATYQDGVPEGNEYFFLDLYRTYGDAQIGNWADYAVAYIEDSALASYTYDVDSNASATAIAEGGTVTFTITRNGSGSASTVYVSTLDGTAADGSDYAGLTTPVTFAANETSKTVTVNTYQDNITEGGEYFYLELFADSADNYYYDWGYALISDAGPASFQGLAGASTAAAPAAAAPQTTLAATSTANQSFPGHSLSEFRNDYAFASIRSDGSVVTWGYSQFGGDNSAVATALDGSIDVSRIFSTQSAFAALRVDGSVVTWGNADAGGNSSSVASQLNGTPGVTKISSTSSAFAAIRSDGSVVTWGSDLGGDSSAVASQINGSIDVKEIYSNLSSFAALRADGSVVTWGYGQFGGDSSAVALMLNGSIDVLQVYSTGSAFAALLTNGSVVTWGNAGDGGDSSAVATKLDGTIDVVRVFSTTSAFAALRADGSLVTWGDINSGGNSSSVSARLDGSTDVVDVASTDSAFAALLADGAVVTWGDPGKGGDSNAVLTQLNGTLDVTDVHGNASAFAALRSDGSVVTWGYSSYGGDSSSVASELDGSIDVKQIIPNNHAFAAWRADGTVVAWGDMLGGGDSTTAASQANAAQSGQDDPLDGAQAGIGSTIDSVTQVFSTSAAFAALLIDGSVVTWGRYLNGGDSSTVSSSLTDISDISNIRTEENLANNAPALATPSPISLVDTSAENSFADVSGNFSASDADGDILAYGISGGSVTGGMSTLSGSYGSLSVNTASGAFSFVPNDTAIEALKTSASETFTITAYDGYTTASGTLAISVTGANDAPRLGQALVDQSVASGSAFSFTFSAGTFSDVEGDALTYGAALSSGGALPNWLSFNPGTRTFSGTPGASDVGALNVRVYATDTGALAGNDSFTLIVGIQRAGTAGNDKLNGSSGNDVFDGGTGIDTAIFLQQKAAYALGTTSSGRSLDGPESLDALNSIERLQFSDLNVALDTDGANSAGGIYRLYQATFDRTPDLGGLGYWITQADGGRSAVRMAEDFTWSQEFQQLYAVTTSDNYLTGSNIGAVVNGLYQNVLHRAPDPGGLAFYTQVIESHEKTVGQVLAEISDSPENYVATIGQIQNGMDYLPWHG